MLGPEFLGLSGLGTYIHPKSPEMKGLEWNKIVKKVANWRAKWVGALQIEGVQGLGFRGFKIWGFKVWGFQG